MKQVITALLILIYASISYSEDVLIVHEGYGNSHSKWKNRLEDAGHTVTSVHLHNSSFPSDTTSYEQIYDLIGPPTHNLTSAMETAYKALLARGGTLYLQMENPGCCNSRNQNIADFIEDDLGGGTITYSTSHYSTNSINTFNSNESYMSSFSSAVTFSSGGTFSSIGNGTWIAKDSSGDIVAAVWYGSDLSNSYTGKVVVITDTDFNASSTYYTNNNKNWMNAMRTMLASTYGVSISITSSQSTTKTAAINADRENGCNVCITQSGAGFTANIQQDGNAHFIVDTDWSGDATVTGDNVTLNIKQGNVTTSGSSDENGLGLSINGDNTNLTVNQGDHANDQGEHKAVIDLNGNSNTVNLTQYDGGTLSKHFSFIDVDALSNNLTITQKDNGQKTIFLDINANSNTGTFIQEDTGLHYLDVTLGSASHTVDITQRGSGNHAARVDLDGYSTDFDLIQQGSTAQSYNLDNTCSNALGCTINTTQGTQ